MVIRPKVHRGEQSYFGTHKVWKSLGMLETWVFGEVRERAIICWYTLSVQAPQRLTDLVAGIDWYA